MSKSKSVLRREFERILGRSVSDRTWQRVRRERLFIENEYDLNLLSDIRIYAWLVKQHPRAQIGFEQVNQYQRLVQGFPVLGGSGDDLYNAIATRLVDERGKTPAQSTIYAWGYQIGVPIYRHRQYSSFEVWKWLKFLIGKKRYQPANVSMKAA